MRIELARAVRGYSWPGLSELFHVAEHCLAGVEHAALGRQEDEKSLAL